jgi:ABC-type sugar transport system ATPase subunit
MNGTAPSGSLMQMSGISKSFAGVHALDGVDLELDVGEVHALCGENGAGKSTLMKILSGIYAIDAGEIRIDGQPRTFATPLDAQGAGIAIVTQELSVVPTLDVASNIMLGHERRRGRVLVDRQATLHAASAVADELEIDLPMRSDAGSLTRGDQQLVEICRALSLDARILILDEPTSSLAFREREHLFQIMDRLRARGVGIVYISHILPEVERVADRVTVLRDGRVVSVRPISECTEAGIIQDMVGREASFERIAAAVPTGEPRRVVLELEDVTTERVKDIDLIVRAGEIVGLAGMMGSGRTELLRATFGLDRLLSGCLRLDGVKRDVRSPRHALALGMALVPEDRHSQGIVGQLSIERNIAMSVAPGRGIWADRRRERALAEEYIQLFSIRASSRKQEIETLSGGNQQKAIIGRALATKPKLLALDEPTAGIDIGAKMDIIASLRALAADGAAILVASSELPELAALCDRVVVMRGGRIAATLDDHEISERAIGHHATREVIEAAGGAL